MKSPASSPDRIDLALLVVSLLGVTASLAGLVGSLVLAISSLVQHDSEGIVFAAWVAAGFAGVGVCGLPAVYITGRSLFGSTPRAPTRPSMALLWLLMLFPMGVLAGSVILRGPDLAQVLFPVAQLAAAGAPVLGAVVLLRFGGPLLPSRRAWGQFLVGLWGMPWLAMLLEVLALVPTVVLLGAGLVTSASGQQLLRRLLDASATQVPSALDQPVLELLLNPWVAATLFAYIAIAVPLIEEAIKSITIWPFLGRELSASVAFVSGALGGAGYALFEALFLTQPVGGWVSTMIGRSGATLMHTLTAGLTCWGLAEGFRRHKWGRLVGPYLAAAAMHGLWNAAAVSAGLASAASDGSQAAITPSAANAITIASAAIMVGLSTFALIGLPLIATRLTRRDASPAGQPAGTGSGG